MMGAAYLFQVVNVLVVVLMVPLLLRYLDVSGFVLWSIFTTFGGITLQLENAIQMVSVREIAREYHSGNVISLRAAVRKAKSAYRILSVSVLVPFLSLGLLYLHYVGRGNLGRQGTLEWLVFIAAYALNYHFGANNSILLGMIQVARFNNINSLTRAINLTSTYLLLKLGLSVMGLSLSFAFSVVIGCLLISRAARESLANYAASPQAMIRPNAEFQDVNSSNVLKYALYTLSSFILYKGSLLIATMIFPEGIIGTYSLALQASTILSTFALLVPLQVRLHRLVSAITSGNRQNVFRELAVGIVAANTIFIAGAVLLTLFGNTLLVAIDSKVLLPGGMNLLVMWLAFLVEVNILLLVNFLVVTGNYRFVAAYVTTSLIGVVLAAVLTWVTKSSIATLILAPLGLQAFVCLPLIFRTTCVQLAITPFAFLSQLGRPILLRS